MCEESWSRVWLDRQARMQVAAIQEEIQNKIWEEIQSDRRYFPDKELD